MPNFVAQVKNGCTWRLVRVTSQSYFNFAGVHSHAIVSGRDKNQVAGLELKETMVLCGRAAQRTHIKNIAVFFHPLEQIQVASGRFSMVTEEAELTRLESELSFLQVKSTMTLQETIRQVKAEKVPETRVCKGTRLRRKKGHQILKKEKAPETRGRKGATFCSK